MKKFSAEFAGTCAIVMAVIGSGIMATKLSSDVGIQLLINAFSTTLTLGIVIKLFNEVSGSHFNPLVTVISLLKHQITKTDATKYFFAQILGGIFGAVLANLMFSQNAITFSTHSRSGLGIYLGEIIATFGLLSIALISNLRHEIIIPAWIASAYFFTSSTSFANPVVTFARSLTDTFAGIKPSSLMGFITAQTIGAMAAFALSNLYRKEMS
jgi:glycerol uptake facilitator-like aquaporin